MCFDPQRRFHSSDDAEQARQAGTELSFWSGPDRRDATTWLDEHGWQ